MPAAKRVQVLVITGLSGSGKTHVSRALEDAGWFCVDNLPTALIPSFVDLLGRTQHSARRGQRSALDTPQLTRSALVVDMREPGFLERFPEVMRRLRRRVAASLLFLEADERVLLRRFSETRRPHPLAVNQPVVEGIREEREALTPIRKMADHILDTSSYTVHQLRDYVRDRYGAKGEAGRMVVSVMSFGYKYGVPSEADLVFDVRFLPNPNFVPRLKKLTGHDAPVVRYLQRQRDTRRLLDKVEDFLGFVLPRYAREGKSYLTIAVGCTGGRHRSVMIANALARRIGGPRLAVRSYHRDVKHG
jgi:UPF0042 nucleotide-binding protein